MMNLIVAALDAIVAVYIAFGICKMWDLLPTSSRVLNVVIVVVNVLSCAANLLVALR